MKLILKYYKIVVLLIFIFPLSLLGDIRTLEDVRKAASGIKTVNAEFQQERYMKILEVPLISKGKFHYKSPEHAALGV